MKIMFFDTETTWFQPPAILQLWVIIWEYSEEWEIIKEDKIDLLFHPNETITEWAAKVHWITYEKIADKPYFNTYIPNFVEHVNNVDLVIWHNVQYDLWAIEFEIKRFYKENWKELDEKASNFINKMREKSKCTMLASVDFCKIPGSYWRYKWAKLSELYWKLFEKTFENAHDAMADISATRDCYFELKKRKII